MKPRISMVALGVKDMEKTIEFFQDKMGFPLFQRFPKAAFFNLNGSWLGLGPRDALAEDVGISPRQYAGSNLAHNVASEEEVVALATQFVAAGGSMVKPPQKADWGGFHCYVRDIDGHLWEIAFNPFAWVGPKD